jgi:predicted extracellular nuclease
MPADFIRTIAFSALLGLTLTACRESTSGAQSPAPLCSADFSPITDVQGKGWTSPLADANVNVRGVVTRVQANRGFYLEEPARRVDPAASRALFVADAELARSVRKAQDVAVSARVTELGTARDTITSLTDVVAYAVCAEAAELPRSSLSLPANARLREGFEGMRLAIEGPLVLSDNYRLARGEIVLSSDAALRIATEEMKPGPSAPERERRDGERSVRAVLPGPAYPPIPVGATLEMPEAVLGHAGDSKALLLDADPRFHAPDPPVLAAREAGTLRIVSMNLLNYFNGDGRGGGFPTARGAGNPAEFERQQARTGAALAKIQPDLLAVQELENDGFGPDSAAQSLLELLNAQGAGDWAFIDPGQGPIGRDVITVGLFYRRASLEPVGPAALLRAEPFQGRSRVPLAQLFRERNSGQSLLVAVNHLKSKGRCPDQGPDADRGDGQGCWNHARVLAVQALLPWLDGLAAQSDTENLLILGDMNAWRREDPITAYRQAGLVELVEELSGLPQHSFLFYGRRGTLDYALASPQLRAFARRAVIWHINADWSHEQTLPRPWLGMSDHDPVIVDFVFSQAATSN